MGGLGFHAYNITKRVGGVSFTNLFYAAPVGAPAALVLAGTLGKAADALVGASSPAARKVEIHRSMSSGGMSSMQAQEKVALPAGGTVDFAPGGYHLMLVGLSKALAPGDAVPVTLIFASGARLQADFRVGTGAGAPAAAMEHMDHMGR